MAPHDTCSPRGSAPSRPAFTLIELLVVVAVIGILASLLMPAILRAMKTAAAANCKSNLKQVHAAMLVYAKQYPLFIVNTRNPPHSNVTTWTYWFDTLEPFAKDRRIWMCPGKEYAAYGYGQNYRVLGGPDSALSLWHDYQSMSVINNPSGTVIFCDTGWVTNKDDEPSKWQETRTAQTRGFCRAHITGYTAWDTDPWRPVPRHPGKRTHCLFFDGHVDSIVTADLVRDWYGDPGCLMDNQ